MFCFNLCNRILKKSEFGITYIPIKNNEISERENKEEMPFTIAAKNIYLGREKSYIQKTVIYRQ